MSYWFVCAMKSIGLSSPSAFSSVTIFHGGLRRGRPLSRKVLKSRAIALGFLFVHGFENFFVRRRWRILRPRTVKTGGPEAGKFGSIVVKYAVIIGIILPT